jgi:NAD(P)H-hydrate epimerase
MLKVTTAKEMQDIDRITIKKYGIAGSVLMENAGSAVAQKINELFTVHCSPFTVFILCGGGNNGGDGFVIARIIHNQGKDIKVFLSAKPEDLKGDAKIKYDEAVKSGIKIFPIKKFLTQYALRTTQYGLIIDALLGTGLNKDVKAPLSDVIKKINTMKYPVVSVDIPSGISSDTGQIMGCAVKADYTVTFGLPKRGHLLYPGAEYTGQLFIENIGFPKKLLNSKKIRVNFIQKQDAVALIPKRPKYSHKGTYGHVLLIAGSRGKTGAAFMSAKACLRAGAGLVTIGVPESLVNIFQSRVTEEMILPLPDKGDGTLSYNASDLILKFLNQKANVLAIGPGITFDNEISKLVCELILNSRAPIVIDADGVNAIAGYTNILRKSKVPVILTPHAGEMVRLLRQSTDHRIQNTLSLTLPPRGGGQGWGGDSNLRDEIEKDRIDIALLFAKKTKTYLVLKGAPTVIATPDGNVFINSTGNPGMATAGTGDVLTGMISALLAQGLTPQNASILGVYMHGLIGDIVAEKKGMHSLIASDIINAIPKVFKVFALSK